MRSKSEAFQKDIANICHKERKDKANTFRSSCKIDTRTSHGAPKPSNPPCVLIGNSSGVRPCAISWLPDFVTELSKFNVEKYEQKHFFVNYYGFQQFDYGVDLLFKSVRTHARHSAFHAFTFLEMFSFYPDIKDWSTRNAS